MIYSDTVMSLFRKPRHAGSISRPDGHGRHEDRVNGNMIEVSLNVDGQKICDIKCRTLGCIPAIAAGEMIVVMAEGKTVTAAAKIPARDVIKALGGLPKEKRHCAGLAVKGLRAAINDYRRRRQDA